DQIVLPPLQHSITPILHKPFKFQETKSPLGITKAGSFGPGFLLCMCKNGISPQWNRFHPDGIKTKNTFHRASIPRGRP
ncbi:MAG: hypothetical protein V3W44_01370, partial [Dehalococcoidales bacterium]